jgi:hypothetical protein
MEQSGWNNQEGTIGKGELGKERWGRNDEEGTMGKERWGRNDGEGTVRKAARRGGKVRKEERNDEETDDKEGRWGVLSASYKLPDED